MVVYATLTVPQMILFESFLSFLGLGVQVAGELTLGELVGGRDCLAQRPGDAAGDDQRQRRPCEQGQDADEEHQAAGAGVLLLGLGGGLHHHAAEELRQVLEGTIVAVQDRHQFCR